MAQGVKRIMPAEFWVDLAVIYPTRGGGKKLAEKYGVDYPFVCRMAKARGIKAERAVRLAFYRESLRNGYFEAMVLELSPQKGGNKKLSDMFGIPMTMIQTAANRFGVCSPQAALIGYHQENLRIDYFDVLDPVRAYWLGYILADGCVAEEKKTGEVRGLYLGCKTSDEDHIFKLRSELNSQHAITRGFKKDKQGNILYDRSGNPIQKTSVCITSPELAETLRDIYGILPQKSLLDQPFPKWVTPEWLPHFARGVFDGDGCVYQGYWIKKQVQYLKYALQYMGSWLFVEGLRDRIFNEVGVYPVKSIPLRNVFYIQWCAIDDIAKLYRWMYPTPDVICLPRKRQYLESMLAGEPVPEITITDESEWEALI